MINKPIKVGFDLDGVLLYNPARVARMPVTLIKKILTHKSEIKFYTPKSRAEKIIWRILHWSSILPASGLDEIKKLVSSGKIEAYLISGRYSFLESDLKWWLNKLKLVGHFTGIHFNKMDEQPHLFKENMIKKLNLDIFVEDNYDIVSHLTKKSNEKTYWIYNLLDHFIRHQYKFSHLQQVVEKIKKDSET